MTPEQLYALEYRLKAFEQRVADAYNAGAIRAPVHLAGGNERQLIEVFQDIGHDDWVCGAWRMHYHCLLKGVPEDQLMADIVDGRSITLNYPEHRIITSAIVGGIIPIALGLAKAIKMAGGAERVWCFVGDMTATTGIFAECHRYAFGHGLPLNIMVEDNGKSVRTPTRATWGDGWPPTHIVGRYCYDLPWPHAGAGQHVKF
jgi:pyruvate dehydrogenase E1 component alpha subunit